MEPLDDCRGAGCAGAPCRRAARGAARGAGRDHGARDGQADGAGARRGRLLRRHLRLLRRQRPGPDEGRADPSARRRGVGDHPPQLAGRDPRDHAVELPDLSGRPLRRARPDHREHGAPQARAAVPGNRRGAAAAVSGRRLPRGRLRQHLRHQRSDRERDRGSARAGRLGDRLRAGGRRGGRDRRPEPEEGGARARAAPTRSSCSAPTTWMRPSRRRFRRAWTTPASRATRPSGSWSSTTSTSRSWRSSPRR